MQRPQRHCAEQRCSRGGFLYVAVMGTATLVAMIALTGLHVARLYLRAAVSEGERVQAQMLASSAVEHAIAAINSNANWESDYSLNVEYPSGGVSVGAGSFSWKLVDAGGGNKSLHGIGRAGEAICTYAVDLGREGGNSYLSYGLLCGNDLWVGAYSTDESLFVEGANICTNDRLESWGSVTGNVEAQVIDNNGGWGTINGTQTAPAPIQSLPDPTNVFDYYEATGTPISASLLSDGKGGLTLSRQLLSPTSNPFGIPNADGIYVIDAAGKGLAIKESRIVGTLVVLNASKGVGILDEVNWEPAIPHYPSILVEGDLLIQMDDGELREWEVWTNFNPTLTPYQDASDLSFDDAYPSRLAGLIYSSRNVFFDGDEKNYVTKVNGLVIANGWCVLAHGVNLEIEYDEAASLSPPPGFRPGEPESIVARSWRQVPSE